MTAPSTPHDLRCTVCASPDVAAVRPGAEPVLAPGGIVLRAAEDARAWCLRHWPCAPLACPGAAEAAP